MVRAVIWRTGRIAKRRTGWLLLVAASLSLAGCDPLDPFAGNSDAGHARIVNDLPFSVDVMFCEEEDCGKTNGLSKVIGADRYRNRGTLEAGYDEPDAYFNVSKRGVPNVYRVVRTSDGREIGCLPLVMPTGGAPLVARISERIPCGRPIFQDRRWPR